MEYTSRVCTLCKAIGENLGLCIITNSLLIVNFMLAQQF